MNTNFEQEIINEVVKKALVNVDMSDVVTRLQKKIPVAIENAVMEWFDDEDLISDMIYEAFNDGELNKIFAGIVKKTILDAFKTKQTLKSKADISATLK